MAMECSFFFNHFWRIPNELEGSTVQIGLREAYWKLSSEAIDDVEGGGGDDACTRGEWGSLHMQVQRISTNETSKRLYTRSGASMGVADRHLLPLL